MHCYMVMDFNPRDYVEAEENLYWKIAINDGDLDFLPSDQRKWIYMDI
jgi:hypothetical protein